MTGRRSLRPPTILRRIRHIRRRSPRVPRTWRVMHRRRMTWSFTTTGGADVTAPVVNSTDPANAASGVAINSTINVSFNEPMNPATITTANFMVTGPGGIPVMGTVAFDPSNNTATFTRHESSHHARGFPSHAGKQSRSRHHLYRCAHHRRQGHGGQPRGERLDMELYHGAINPGEAPLRKGAGSDDPAAQAITVGYLCSMYAGEWWAM